MNSLKISTGVISLEILDDDNNSRGVFRFNPSDVKCAERLYKAYSEFDGKQKEYETRLKEIDESDVQQRIALLSELCDYFRTTIDECFGAGSSDLLFGDAVCLEMFNDFFTGILPYYQKASKDRLAKYSTKKSKK